MKTTGFLGWLQDKILGRWWVKYFLLPGIEATPTALVALWLALGHTTFWADANAKFPGYNTAWLVLAAALLGGLLSGLETLLTDQGQQLISDLTTERRNLLRLLGYVRVIVNAKSVRFHDTLNRLGEKIKPDEAFLTITQPQEQIKEIIRNTYDYFFHISDEKVSETGSVCLMRWNDRERHLDFDVCFPVDSAPRTSPTEFGDNSTIAGRANADREMVISADLANDSRYKRLSDATNGSMFAYPVWDDFAHRIEFVINVTSTKIKRFQEEDREALKIPMRVFGERLLLENRLVELRRRATAA